MQSCPTKSLKKKSISHFLADVNFKEELIHSRNFFKRSLIFFVAWDSPSNTALTSIPIGITLKDSTLLPIIPHVRCKTLSISTQRAFFALTPLTRNSGLWKKQPLRFV